MKLLAWLCICPPTKVCLQLAKLTLSMGDGQWVKVCFLYKNFYLSIDLAINSFIISFDPPYIFCTLASAYILEIG